MTNTARFLIRTIAGTLLVASAVGADTAPVWLQGAEPGGWTMDLDSAVVKAREKHLPILLNFTGSDWCSWCQVMERKVFSRKEWADYAAGHLLLVWIDAPQDPSLVPVYFVARNRKLAQKYELEGPPLYIILDDDGQTVLGRLGARRNTTVKSFIEEVDLACRCRPEAVETFAKTLSPEDAKAYRKLAGDVVAARAKLFQFPQRDSPQKDAAAEAVARLEDELERYHIEARAKELGPEQGPRYRKLSLDLISAEEEFNTWLVTKPSASPENQKTFQGFMGRMQALRTEIEKF